MHFPISSVLCLLETIGQSQDRSVMSSKYAGEELTPRGNGVLVVLMSTLAYRYVCRNRTKPSFLKATFYTTFL